MAFIPKLLMGVIVAIVLTLIAYYGYLFFFSRGGITVSASEICVQNETEQTLVFLASADNGAEFLEMLAPQQQLCAPSPVTGDTGQVGAFESEGSDQNCSRQTISGKLEVLTKFSGSNDCGWETR